jgi:hypothetical protein
LWEEIKAHGYVLTRLAVCGALEVEEDDEPFEREDAAAGGEVGGAVYPKCKARGREEAKF